ncbi:MAG: GDSL-type esterase/lipase family protein, partial [Aristaeellaceae bacterium]
RQAEHVRLLGRYDPQQSAFPMYWTGSGVEICIRCVTLQVEIEADYVLQCPWMGVLVDGAPAARFALERGKRWYTLLGGMDDAAAHTVTLLRDTQPVAEDEGLYVTAHRLRTDGTLLPLTERALAIEFIGDSLTSGEGLIGPEGAMEWRTIWLSGMESWAMEVCRAMNAQGRWISQSGWGVYWSWDGKRENRLPRIYDAVCAVERDGDRPYAFAEHPVDAVVINLGTNDAAALAGLEGAERERAAEAIQEAAAEFLRQVRRRNPEAYVLWAYGMGGCGIAPLLRGAVRRVRQEGDGRVGYAALPVCPAQALGSRAHPGKASHRRAAQVIVRRLHQAIRLKEGCYGKQK